MMKISKVLIDSQKTRKQMTGGLVMPNFAEPKSYCALGALACENGLFENGVPEYVDIIKSYGTDPTIMVELPNGHETLAGQSIMLVGAIWRLNDSYGWSFKKIGKWIEKLEKKGVIKYE